MINTYNLFAVQMSHCKLPLNIDILKKINSFVENKYKEDNTLSCVKGFQFHENFNGKKELNNYLSTFLKNTFCLELDNTWLNVLGDHSYNKPHYHLSNENNVITFVKGSETFEIKPKIFDLLIFPNNLVHYVLAEKRLEKRISYAFNLIKF